MNEEIATLQLVMNFDEEWRDVVGWTDLYEVSNMGRVRAKKSRLRGHYKAGDVLKTRFNPHGYVTTVLCRGQERRSVFVHHLVMYAFVGPRPEGHDINHKDGVKENNRLSNLEYLTHRENILHAFEVLNTYRSPAGDPKMSFRFTPEQVHEVKRRLADGARITHLSREYGCSVRAIRLIRDGKTGKRAG